MDAGKRRKAQTVGRSETMSVRTEKKTKSLAEIAARLQGITTSNYIEQLLSDDLVKLKAPNRDGDERTLASIVDELYDDDDVTCFWKRARNHPWAMNDVQRTVSRLIEGSRQLSPKAPRPSPELLREHWPAIFAVASKQAEFKTLPEQLFKGLDIEFALMSETERMALYKIDQAGFTERSSKYLAAIKKVSYK